MGYTHIELIGPSPETTRRGCKKGPENPEAEKNTVYFYTCTPKITTRRRGQSRGVQYDCSAQLLHRRVADGGSSSLWSRSDRCTRSHRALDALDCPAEPHRPARRAPSCRSPKPTLNNKAIIEKSASPIHNSDFLFSNLCGGLYGKISATWLSS